MKYITDECEYIIHYNVLKEEYERFCSMEDKEFLENILHAAHLSCVISYLKELGAESTIADRGIVHELIHLATLEGYIDKLEEIREKFKTLLKLS